MAEEKDKISEAYLAGFGKNEHALRPVQTDALVPVRMKNGKLYLVEVTGDTGYPSSVSHDGYSWIIGQKAQSNTPGDMQLFVAGQNGPDVPKGLNPKNRQWEGGWVTFHPVTNKRLAAEIEGWLQVNDKMASQRTDVMARGPDYYDGYYQQGKAAYIPMDDFRHMVAAINSGNVMYGSAELAEVVPPPLRKQVTRHVNPVEAKGVYNPLSPDRYTGQPNPNSPEYWANRRPEKKEAVPVPDVTSEIAATPPTYKPAQPEKDSVVPVVSAAAAKKSPSDIATAGLATSIAGIAEKMRESGEAIEEHAKSIKAAREELAGDVAKLKAEQGRIEELERKKRAARIKAADGSRKPAEPKKEEAPAADKPAVSGEAPPKAPSATKPGIPSLLGIGAAFAMPKIEKVMISGYESIKPAFKSAAAGSAKPAASEAAPTAPTAPDPAKPAAAPVGSARSAAPEAAPTAPLPPADVSDPKKDKDKSSYSSFFAKLAKKGLSSAKQKLDETKEQLVEAKDIISDPQAAFNRLSAGLAATAAGTVAPKGSSYPSADGSTAPRSGGGGGSETSPTPGGGGAEDKDKDKDKDKKDGMPVSQLLIGGAAALVGFLLGSFAELGVIGSLVLGAMLAVAGMTAASYFSDGKEPKKTIPDNGILVSSEPEIARDPVALQRALDKGTTAVLTSNDKLPYRPQERGTPSLPG